MNYKINPCHACMEKYKKNNCDINNINNCCYETLAAFYGIPNVNRIRDTKDAENCVKCLYNQMKNMGRTPCDFQLAPPPIFAQVPHYFPKYLAKSNDIQKAKQLCIQKCNSNIYSEECKENCITDSLAVESYHSIEPSTKETKKITENKKKSKFGIILGIIILLLLIIFIFSFVMLP